MHSVSLGKCVKVHVCHGYILYGTLRLNAVECISYMWRRYADFSARFPLCLAAGSATSTPVSAGSSSSWREESTLAGTPGAAATPITLRGWCPSAPSAPLWVHRSNKYSAAGISLIWGACYIYKTRTEQSKKFSTDCYNSRPLKLSTLGMMIRDIILDKRFKS